MRTRAGGASPLAGSRRFILLLFAFLPLAFPFAVPGTAKAHPLGNFTINRWARIELYRDAVRIDYVLDFAEIPSFEEMAAIDANNDGASAEELREWAERVAGTIPGALQLSIGGEAAPLRLVTTGGSTATGQSNLPILRFEAVFEAAVPRPVAEGSAVAVALRDTNYSDRLGWRELVIAPSAGATTSAPPGYTDRSLSLSSYPASSLDGAPDEREVSLTWVAGTGEAAPRATLTAGEARATADGGLTGLLGRNRSAGVVILSLMGAAGFGMVHALGPGHGKAIVAAYLVGRRGTVRRAVALGLTVTATHTAAVYAIGGVAILASHYILPERLYLGLNIVSGLLVAGFGLGLLAQRLRASRGSGEHRHAPWGKAHSHGVEPLHATHDHSHEGHSHGGHDHSHHADRASEPREGWFNVLALGVLGGMVPCPSAIVVMLAAVSIGQAAFGMLLIVAFSMGLAGVLTAIGIGVVLSQRLAARLPARSGALQARLAWAQRVALIGSPFAITAIGVALTVRAFAV